MTRQGAAAWRAWTEVIVVPLLAIVGALGLAALAPEVARIAVAQTAGVEDLVLVACWGTATLVLAWTGTTALAHAVARAMRLPRLAAVTGRLVLPWLRTRIDRAVRGLTVTGAAATLVAAPGAAIAQPVTPPADVLAASDHAHLPPWLRPPPAGEPAPGAADDARTPVDAPDGAAPDAGSAGPTTDADTPAGPTDTTEERADRTDDRAGAAPGGADVPGALPLDRPRVPAADDADPRDAVATAGPSTVVVQAGDSLWCLAARQVAARLDRPPTDDEVARHWHRVVTTVTVPSGDPDLLHVGDVLRLPAVAAASPRTTP